MRCLKIRLRLKKDEYTVSFFFSFSFSLLTYLFRRASSALISAWPPALYPKSPAVSPSSVCRRGRPDYKRGPPPMCCPANPYCTLFQARCVRPSAPRLFVRPNYILTYPRNQSRGDLKFSKPVSVCVCVCGRKRVEGYCLLVEDDQHRLLTPFVCRPIDFASWEARSRLE